MLTATSFDGLGTFQKAAVNSRDARRLARLRQTSRKHQGRLGDGMGRVLP